MWGALKGVPEGFLGKESGRCRVVGVGGCGRKSTLVDIIFGGGGGGGGLEVSRWARMSSTNKRRTLKEDT